jgi:replicative DNA helicase
MMADLRADDPPVKTAPSNIEAEQAVLGCLLYNNDAFHRYEGLRAQHFHDPYHQRLYEVIAALIGKGQLAEPILLSDRFREDPAFEEMGGTFYFADLVDRAPPAANVAAYALQVIDLSMRRDLIRISGDIAAEAMASDNDKSGREQVEAAELELFALGETQATRGFQPFTNYIQEAIDQAIVAHSQPGGLSGISTGLADLDAKLGGLHRSDLIIIGGRPSMGKSSLAVNIGLNVARAYAATIQPDGTMKPYKGGRVGFFSLEMSGPQLAMRMMAEISRVAGDRVRRGAIEYQELSSFRDAGDEIRTIPFHIDDSGSLTIAQLATRARRLKRTKGLDLLIVDYLQLLTGSKGARGDNRVQEVSEITVGLKGLAKELDIPVIALAQLSRTLEGRDDKRPQLSDLRESGSIEQDADVVMFCYREEYYVSRLEPAFGHPTYDDWMIKMEEVKGKGEIILGKQRHGPIGKIELGFNGELTQFFDLPRHYSAGGPPRSPHASD